MGGGIFCDYRAGASQGALCWYRVSLLSIEDLTMWSSSAFPFITERVCLRSKASSDGRPLVTKDTINAREE